MTPEPSSSTITTYFSDPIDTRITRARKTLQKKTAYLGDADWRKRLIWYHSNKSDIVVDKKALPTDATKPSSSKPIETTQLIPIHLSTIAILTPEDFWLSSDGYWKERVEAAQTLADVKLTCTAAAPPRRDLAADFKRTIDTIDALTARFATAGHKIQSIRVNCLRTSQPKLKLRHKLFKVRVPFHMALLTDILTTLISSSLILLRRRTVTVFVLMMVTPVLPSPVYTSLLFNIDIAARSMDDR